MKMVRSISVVSTAMTLVLLLASCAEQACYDNTDPMMNALLLESGTGVQANAESLVVTAITATDTIEFVDAKSVSSFSLPLDPGNDVSTFYIVLDGIADTAVIIYTRHPHLVSAECGYTFVSELTGLRTTHNIIDTLIIENKSVNLNGKRNLHLFY
jgi:hypothetical protein